MDPRSVALICITAVVCVVILASAIACRATRNAEPFGWTMFWLVFVAFAIGIMKGLPAVPL